LRQTAAYHDELALEEMVAGRRVIRFDLVDDVLGGTGLLSGALA
jgi:hypothetical protein